MRMRNQKHEKPIITLVGILEPGYTLTKEKFSHKSTPEFLGWKQLAGAYQVKLALVGFHYDTIEEALENQIGRRIFFIPPDRTESIDFKDFTTPLEDNIAYIFGCAGNNLTKYIKEGDTVVSIHTPFPADLMAISVVGIILNKHRNL